MSLYFLAFIPPGAIKQEVKLLKEEIRLKFAAKHALKLPAHITIQPPFKLQEDNKVSLLETLRNFAKEEEPLEIHLSGFGGFPPRVLFIDVQNKELVIQFFDRLQDALLEIPNFSRNHKRPLHPHITLATRDLREEFYRAAWKDYKDRKYTAAFTAASLHLLRHTGKTWEIYCEFLFGEKRS